MIELRFDRTIYSGQAVDEAIKALQRWAELHRVDDPNAWVVRVSSDDPRRERLVAGELGNHALGLTVERGGPDPVVEDAP